MNKKSDEPVARCPHCGAAMHHYRCVIEEGPDGWPISVKVCRLCSNKWLQAQISKRAAGEGAEVSHA